MIDLNNEIFLLNQKLAQEIPSEFFNVFQQSIDDFQIQQKRSIPKLGEVIPSFSLPNTKNTWVTSSELLKNKKYLIIAFFRGSWCPYCNLELKALQEIYSSIQSKNSELVAISPQYPSFNSELEQMQNLSFSLLTVTNNAYAEKLAITIKVQDFVLPYYEKLGISLTKYNGNDSYILPIPAVFVIDTSHVLSYSFGDVNYINRIDLHDIHSII